MSDKVRDRPGKGRSQDPTPEATVNLEINYQGQLTTVLDRLTSGPAVCSTEFLSLRIPRAAAHVHRLRNAGFLIVTEPCSRPGHRHRTRQIQYRLEVAQLRLPLGLES